MKKRKPHDAVVYCDASVRPKHHNGIGICLLDKEGALVAKASRRVLDCGGSSNVLEGRGILEGIALAIRHGFKSVRVYTDNKGLVCAAGGRGGNVATTKNFVRALNKIRAHIRVSLCWVRGHAGNKWNVTCDKLARNARWTFSQVFSAVCELVGIKKPIEVVIVGKLVSGV